MKPGDKTRLKRLDRIVERVTDGDRDWFKTHPERRYRIRLASRAEIEVEGILVGKELRAPGLEYWAFTLVKNVKTGVRLRRILWRRADTPTDLDASEEMARATYEAMTTEQTRLVERQLAALNLE
jgi:hypothetical protein